MNFKDIKQLLQETWAEFQDDEAGQRGAALSYYSMFSIFPLVLLLVAIIGFVLRSPDNQSAQQQVLDAVARNISPSISNTLAQALSAVKSQAGGATIIGLITLLLGASGVFQQLDLTMNKIWNVPPKQSAGGILGTIMSTVRDRLVSFGMVLSLGFLLIVSLALTVVTQALNGVLQNIPLIGGVSGEIFGIISTLLLNTLIVALIFKYLPRTSVQWGDVIAGAAVTAVIWEIAKRLLALYMSRSSYTSAYGLIGSVLVLMTWIYFTSQILFLGAEFTQVYARRHGSRSPAAKVASADASAAPNERKQPLLLPAPEPARGFSETKKVAIAAGAGLVVGALGTLITSIVVAIRTARSANSAVRRGKR
ncbi:MAG TPA: YihY/virulence factor BrkB family protein [Roseiflexaceae bacterium]|jgi:membrane protein|nr:YihY/virulence factor BrkB family protein [Roseiflexaceae bacterium]